MNASGELARWRFASRLARREVRRRPGRTVLVALLVAVPVAGMTIFGVLARSGAEDDWFVRDQPDSTDLVVTRSIDQAIELDDHLPSGASTSEMLTVWASVEASAGIVPVVQFWDEGNFGTGSVLSTTMGREPQNSEVWLTSKLADELGVTVGDALALDHPDGVWTVAGIGESRRSSGERLIVMPDLPVDQFREGIVQRVTLIDLPPDVTPDEVDQIGWELRSMFIEDDAGTWAWWIETDESSDTDLAPLAWNWVAGTVGLAATGIIISAAFATSARRQLVTIGLLSSNGSSERLTRRMIALQGAWTGVAGSVVGLVIGLVVLIAGRSTIERVRGHAFSSYQFGAGYLLLVAATGVVASTIAALVPARTASKVPVMAALAGRRPLGAVPPRLVSRGLALSALGALLLVMAAVSSDGGVIPTTGAILGGVLVLVGMCCCSPLAVDWMGRASGSLKGSWRLAGRGLGRTRTRSAAVVTAIAVIAALTTGGAAVAATANDDDGPGQLPADAFALIPNRDYVGDPADEIDLGPSPNRSVDDSMIATIERLAPSSSWHPRRVATWDPAPIPVDAYGGWSSGLTFVEFVIGDEAMMDLYDLSTAERDALDEVGLLALSPDYAWTGATSGGVLRIPTEQGDVALDFEVRDYVVDSMRGDDNGFDGVRGFDAFMITEAAARAAGFDIVTRGGFARSDTPLTESQRFALQEAIYGFGVNGLGQYYRDVPTPPGEEGSQWNLQFDWPDDGPSSRAIQGIMVAIALVLTLLVVAIGLTLAAAEGANERDVLVAIGGRPGTMRSMAGAKATMLTFTGVVLAVPFGLLPTLAVIRAIDNRLAIPWLVIGALVVVVPLLAGGAAWAVSAIAQRARPVRMSDLAFD